MPAEKEISEIWKENIEKFLAFINLAKTGVKGFVKDHNGIPLRHARITVKGSERVHNVSKNLAFFHVLVPSGSCELTVSSENFTSKTIGISVSNNMVDLGEVMLIPDTSTKSNSHNDVSGFVTDENGTPVTTAEIGIKGIWNKKAYTNHIGQFEMKDINSDSAILTVNARGFAKSEKLVMMNLQGTTKNIIFKLTPSDEDMGFNNLIFIFFVCIAILCSVVCVTFFAINGCAASCPCAEWFSRGKNRHLAENYKFSLLTKKSKRPTLFEDEFGDDEEEELFSPTTLKRKLFHPQ